MKPTVFFLLSLWMAVYSIQLKAEKNQLICRNLTESNGLSDNRVTCFFKDRTGFMWIGTENGLNRYDGHNFIVYRPGQESFAISNEFITGIGQDENGMLWVATRNGLNMLDVENDSLTTFLPVNTGKENQGIANSDIRDLYAVGHKIWLAIDNRDLGVFDTRTKKFSYFPWKKYLTGIFPEYINEYCAIQSIRPGYPNGLWLGTSMGLFGYDTLSNHFRFLGGGQRKEVLMLTTGKDRYGKNFAFFHQEFQNPAVCHPASGYTLLDTPADGVPFLPFPANLDLWLNRGNDLLRYESGTNRMVRTQLAIPDKVIAPSVRTTFSDESQNCLWIAAGKGCYLYSGYLNLFPFTQVSPDNAEEPISIRSAINLNDSTDWLVDISGRLIIKTGSDNLRYINRINGIPLKESTFLFPDSENNIWLLTNDHLFRYNQGTSAFSEIKIPLPGKKVYRVMRQAANGDLWVGTINSGVYIMEKSTGSWKKWQDSHQPVMLYIQDILLDRNGRHAWFATSNLGLVRYDIKSQKTEYFSKDDTPSNGLNSATFTSLTQTPDGVVWIGSEWGGLSRYTGEGSGFVTYNTRNGLPENTIYAILAGKDNGLWISCAKGLVYFDGKEKVTHQWLSSGHPMIKPGRALLHPDEKNGFILPVEQGFIRVKWPSGTSANTSYPLIMKEIRVNDTIPAPSESVFPYHRNQISFHYQLLRYDSPGDVYYEHRLEGMEQGWQKTTGSIANTDYYNLPPGEFNFVARAFDGLGHPLSNELCFSFSIKKPLWMRWELWLAGALTLLSALYLLWRRQVRQLADEKIINYFATSLYGRNTVEDVFWDISKNCISQLNFEDCVLYQYDEERRLLVQKAAYGPKNPEKREILNPIVIPLGKGITGYAALHGKYVLVRDTTKDSRYILDDQERLSELAVPIFIGGKIFGVIDSEHSKKNFYTRRHVRILQKIAGLCSQKLTLYLTEEKLRASIARDLHDEIGSTLTSINIISKIAIEQHNQDKVFDYLSRIRENSSTMMDAMSDMVWAINPENDSFSRMIIRLKEFCSEILDPAGITYFFNIDETLLNTRLTLGSRKDLYLILKEAVTNAAKYSKADKVLVGFHDNIHSVEIKVEDNGIGMDPSLATSGNGLRNMTHRATAIRSELVIESKKGEGTKVIVNIPV